MSECKIQKSDWDLRKDLLVVLIMMSVQIHIRKKGDKAPLCVKCDKKIYA